MRSFRYQIYVGNIMNCKATIIKDEDEYIVTEVITHIVSLGKTREAAIDNLRLAMEQYYEGINQGAIQIDVIG